MNTIGKTKATPGPWTTGDSGLTVLSKRNQRIADIYEPCQFDSEARANAALIASAPDLHNLVKCLCECLNNYGLPGNHPELWSAGSKANLAMSAIWGRAKGTL